tara:strand:+ start:4484 stop:5611 length:1128 start_codon:yes stop_codon:yes gene_type:complete
MAELTFAEDFSTNVSLDSTLKGTPDSGLYWNQGVHPLLTVDNIKSILPKFNTAITVWRSSVAYTIYTNSFELVNIVTYNDIVYQSISSNTNKQPDTNPSDWLQTNIDSLRFKNLINSSKSNLIANTMLTRKLIENQYIYHVAKTDLTLDGDYSGWAFEPKGSDYVKIRLNQIAFQGNTTTPQNLYVVNQGQLITTLTLNPNNGILEFEDLGYTISGKGTFYFLVDSQSVKSDSSYNDPLKYDGFVCYPVSANGTTPEGSDIAISGSGNGLNFNVTAYLDSSEYISNNIVDFARAWQLQFAYDVTRTYLYNPSQRSNRNERIGDANLLQVEALDTNLNTVAKLYEAEIKTVKIAVNKTFDRFLKSKPAFTVKTSTY